MILLNLLGLGLLTLVGLALGFGLGELILTHFPQDLKGSICGWLRSHNLLIGDCGECNGGVLG